MFVDGILLIYDKSTTRRREREKERIHFVQICMLNGVFGNGRGPGWLAGRLFCNIYKKEQRGRNVRRAGVFFKSDAYARYLSLFTGSRTNKLAECGLQYIETVGLMPTCLVIE